MSEAQLGTSSFLPYSPFSRAAYHLAKPSIEVKSFPF